MNPVLWMELRIRIRERKLWVVSLLFLACIAVMSLGVVAGSRARPMVSRIQSPADIGSQMIRSEAGFLMGLLLVLAPLAGAGRIAQEREQRTLAGLLNTPLSRWSIVRGKLFSTWAFVAWLWFLGIPFFTAAYLWGGLDFGEGLRMVGIILAAGLTVATLSLGLSGFFSRSLTSYLGTGAVLFFWLAAWPLLASLCQGYLRPLLQGPALSQQALTAIFYYHNPMTVLFSVNDPAILLTSLGVWSAIMLVSVFLAHRGLQRGLYEKP